MAELSQEQFEQLPDFVKGDYEKAGEVYRPVAEGKLSVLKGKMNELDDKFKTTDSQLKEILAKHEDDRTKAEQAALERLKKEGKVDEIVSDLTRRHGETVKQFEDRLKARDDRFISTERKNVVGDIAKELKILDKSEKLFSKIIQDRIDVDPETGKITFLDENGGATSLDKAGFIAELAKDEGFDTMRSADVSRGGMANGNNGSGGGASKIMKRSEFEALDPVSRSKFMKEGGKLKD